ncbi:hypothetical protein QN277_011718 [Acacia crassicarpa]|uniref:DUF7812 domain-containing protein n=1 Tax=Acacia crassicarpa TaxID=499986 RepID=A0AAE1MZE8_9FABA|nr:hypothetical protein QN277_011718 [Acacia crassicarpa]
MSKLPDLLLHLRRSHGDGVATRDDFDLCGLKVNFKDLCLLSDDLFKLLHVKFEIFFSVLRDLSESGSRQVPELHSKLWKIVKDLTLVLRSCLIILTLLESEQQSLLKKCCYICQILKIFSSTDVNGRNGRTQITFENLASCEFSASSAQHSISFSFELCDRCRPFLCSVLEAFADECLKHPSLRKYIMYVESSYSIIEKNSTFHLNHGYIASVLEIVSAHFLLSVSDEQALENFFSRLLLPCGKDSRDLELSLEASMSLLLNPILLSAPKMFQAHLISLVSEAVGSVLPSQNLISDRLLDRYLTAFERSIILYSMHASSLQTDGPCLGLKCSDQYYLLGKSQITFEAYIQHVTKNKLEHLVSKLDGSWDSYHCKMSSKTEANLLTEYISFMKESQHIFPDSCRTTIVSFMECIICRTFSENAAGDEFYTKNNSSAQDISLLTSILKLMSVSLIQATLCLSRGSNSGCLKTLQNASLSKKYDFLINTISRFQQCNMCLPIQNILSDVMKSHLARHKRSKSILLHFSGLLSSSFIHGFDILAKACISVIMALMYLFIFEEGDLIALGSLKDLPLQSLPSEMPLAKSREAVGNRTSYKVASEFHKIWARHFRMNSPSSFRHGIQDNEAESSLIEPILNPFSYGSEEETCSGEVFLECLFEKSRRCDYADLVDFIECKRGKDYHGWLKNREKYRRWKHNKVDNMRKKKKKMLWKVLSGSKTSSSKDKMKRRKW